MDQIISTARQKNQERVIASCDCCEGTGQRWGEFVYRVDQGSLEDIDALLEETARKRRAYRDRPFAFAALVVVATISIGFLLGPILNPYAPYIVVGMIGLFGVGAITSLISTNQMVKTTVATIRSYIPAIPRDAELYEIATLQNSPTHPTILILAHDPE